MDENNNGIQLDASGFSTDLMAAEVPTLTFGEPEPEAPVVALEAPKPQIEAPKDEDILTEAERRQVEALAKQINLRDTNGILQYGAGTQKKMSDFSDAALATVKTRDLGEVGEMLSGVINNLEEFNPNEKEESGFFGLFKKPKKKLDDIKVQYDKANVNVEKVAKALQEHQVILMKDIATLDKMYASNLVYYKELTMYILAGKKAIENLKNGELAELRAKAERSGLSEDAQAVRDLEDQINRFEKKIHDLELTRTIAIQTAPQIRLIQSSDTMMVEKIQSTIVNTIPLWKNQMVLALGIEDSTKAAKAEAAVTEMTNKLLNSNAEKLKIATIETAKASERGIVDMETLRKTNESLISTLDEVARIQDEGRTKRREAEAELANLERELKDKLLTMNR
ncbi:MAG TPA: toxic anion resistance protein [Lachnospiraceae bacterium]|nr:toxic anion resistance protein [Lachnospiraceae bacterium]HAV27208.1 toxic anion resistance protein [Lachnospiraceae bacterium]